MWFHGSADIALLLMPDMFSQNVYSEFNITEVFLHSLVTFHVFDPCVLQKSLNPYKLFYAEVLLYFCF